MTLPTGPTCLSLEGKTLLPSENLKQIAYIFRVPIRVADCESKSTCIHSFRSPVCTKVPVEQHNCTPHRLIPSASNNRTTNPYIKQLNPGIYHSKYCIFAEELRHTHQIFKLGIQIFLDSKSCVGDCFVEIGIQIRYHLKTIHKYNIARHTCTVWLIVDVLYIA